MSDCTPEDFFTIPATAEPGYPIDAIECALVRADAMLVMLISQFNGESQTKHNDYIVCHALWAVQGELGLLTKMVKHGFETEKKI